MRISCAEFADDLDLIVINPDSKECPHYITDADLSRPGLQFAGYFGVFASERPQIIGKAEMAYLQELPEELRRVRVKEFFSYPIPCVVIARGMECPEDFLSQAREHRIPIYGTKDVTSFFVSRGIQYLSERFAPMVSRHGVLVDVYGLGIMIIGDSGIGKSECALELINHGHQLVSDDVVEISRVGGRLFGCSPEITRDFMELRGVGIVDVREIFGIGAIRRRTKIDLIISLEVWVPNKDYDRLGQKYDTLKILDVELPELVIPVRPGRSLATIIEIAARRWRLHLEGYDATSELDRRLKERYESIQNSQEP